MTAQLSEEDSMVHHLMEARHPLAYRRMRGDVITPLQLRVLEHMDQALDLLLNGEQKEPTEAELLLAAAKRLTENL